MRKVYDLISSDPAKIQEIFDFNKTEHADLDLSWMDPRFQEKEFGPENEYQIVIATVQPGQKSKAHFHEVGASSFVVLGPKMSFPEPKDLIYIYGKLNQEVKCYEGLELDIPSNTTHQFVNKHAESANVLIVTHPIISVRENKEDIHYANH